MTKEHLIYSSVFVAAVFFAVFSNSSAAQPLDSQKYSEIKTELSQSSFPEPLLLFSYENGKRLAGEVFAELDHPLELVASRMNSAASWCSILVLHPNMKHCAVSRSGDDEFITVNIGRKFDQPLDKTREVAFAFKVLSANPDYFHASVSAEEGPFSTSDYAFDVQAIPISEDKTLLKLAYGYTSTTSANLATKAYLNTIGRDKVGFSKDIDGELIQGVRGVMERNIMRYYLAIKTRLDLPENASGADMSSRWFEVTNAYARQLRELSKEEYLDMKAKEFSRSAKINQ